MPDQDWQTMHDSLAALQETLFHAALKAGSDDLRERLRAGAEAAADAVETMDRDDFESRTARFQAVSEQARKIAGDLDALRKQIAAITDKTDALKSAVEAIGQVLSQVSKFGV